MKQSSRLSGLLPKNKNLVQRKGSIPGGLGLLAGSGVEPSLPSPEVTHQVTRLCGC